MNKFYLEFVEDLKNDLISSSNTPDLSTYAIIDKKELNNDPDFKDLNNSLNSIGYSIKILKIRKRTVYCEIQKLNDLK